VQAGRHLILPGKGAEQSNGTFTYSLKAPMAHSKLEMWDVRPANAHIA
jgi:hypothetical protein